MTDRLASLLRGLIFLAVVAASLIVAAFARAAAPATPPPVQATPVIATSATNAWRQTADIRVRVIQARNAASAHFDPHLDDLRKLLDGFKTYDFKQVIDQSLQLGLADEENTKGIGLLSGMNLNVTLKSLTREQATIRLLLVGQTGKMLDTVVSSAPHKLFFIAGPRYDNGVLFIAIEPHYDPDSVDPAVSQTSAPAPH